MEAAGDDGRPVVAAQHAAAATRSRSMWRRDVSNVARPFLEGAMPRWSHKSGRSSESRGRCHVTRSARPADRDNVRVTGFPLLLHLAGRRVVVVGGGVVASRRTRGLHEAGADVLVVAPQILDEIAALVPTQRRAFVPADLDGAWLAMACTDDPVVNAEVAAAAEARQIFCVRADAASGGTARTAAVARREGVTVAVNGGDDPSPAGALRDALAAAFGLGGLPAPRVRPASRGEVALVGGGPGDPDLITVRGRRLIAQADVVVVDRLAPRDLLATLADDVEVIDCGKSAHRHNLTQGEINAVLVDRALAGKRVVRLKGGDPFVFGRGGEEGLPRFAGGGAGTPLARPPAAAPPPPPAGGPPDPPG